MLQLEGSKRSQGMTMDTDNALVIVDLNNNQLRCEDSVGKENADNNRGWRQRCITTMGCRTGRSA